MNMKNILTIVFLGAPLVYGMPVSLKKEVERARCVIRNLPPAPVPPERLLAAQTTIENCIKNLERCLEEGYDREVENKMLLLDSDLDFLKGCAKILLGEEGFDSPTAEQWRKSSYIVERYLSHFQGQ